MPKNNTVPGAKVRHLLQSYNLYGDEAARIAGKILGYKMEHIQQRYSRSFRFNDYKLLQLELAKKYGK